MSIGSSSRAIPTTTEANRSCRPRHEEIELALCKLYRVTGDGLYLEMAKRFLDIRGVTFRPDGEGVLAPSYAQQHLP